MNIIVQGLDILRAGMQRLADWLSPGHQRNRLERLLEEARQYAASVTHVDTGTLRSGHTYQIIGSGDEMSGVLFVDRAAFNYEQLRSAADYAPYEHNRGGAHAFYELTAQHFEGSRLIDYYLEDIPR